MVLMGVVSVMVVRDGGGDDVGGGFDMAGGEVIEGIDGVSGGGPDGREDR